MTGPGVLHAWLGDSHAGVFFYDGNGDVAFEYDPGAATPISLSLPLEGGWTRRAPGAFLDNLLPDDPLTRTAMARALDAGGDTDFDLLDGVDSAGGIVFTHDGRPPSAHAPATPLPATQDELRHRLEAASRTTGLWWDHDSRIRFSLAGNQPKITLNLSDGAWYWPNAQLPSTHILKPSNAQIDADVAVIEAASARLARLCGIDAPRSGLDPTSSIPVFVTERFDRTRDAGGNVTRLHAEDLLQSLGRRPGTKYNVTAEDVIGLLGKADPTLCLAYGWIAQLAFNTCIGNADAHAKNYSVLMGADGMSLSPMYDLATTSYWPWVDGALAMPIGDATTPQTVTARSWRKLAGRNGLDEDAVVTIARSVSDRVTERAPAAYDGVEPRIADRALRCIEKANAGMNDGHRADPTAIRLEIETPAPSFPPLFPGP